jgi:hypothetical protein
LLHSNAKALASISEITPVPEVELVVDTFSSSNFRVEVRTGDPIFLRMTDDLIYQVVFMPPEYSTSYTANEKSSNVPFFALFKIILEPIRSKVVFFNPNPNAFV